MGNSVLTVVDMRDTEMRNEAAKEIAESMKINKNLTHLNVEWNLFSPTYLDSIEKSTRKNKSHARKASCPG